ncbi:MAG: putative sugar nucleotidyl transferase [Phycisphaerae bacterium]|jgi:UDP-N-acetylglucosamine diphosphorylase/glucosamine-1-phosphate N-acetyltransferase
MTKTNKQLVLFEDEGYVDLLPLVYWRSVFELQVGRKIVLDRIAQRLGLPVSGVWARDWLAPVAAQRCGAPANQSIQAGTILVNGRWILDEEMILPDGPVVGVIDQDVAYIVCDAKLAGQLAAADLLDATRRKLSLEGVPTVDAPGRMFHYPWDIMASISELLEGDWSAGDAVIESELDAKVVLEPRDRIHVGERTEIHPTAVIDATAGPVYISHDVRIGAYSVIEGPAYFGPCSRVNPHSWLHGGNVIGPVCKVGGELHACVLNGYTNKQHNGFLGHSYVGSWVNIGAGANNSDLKNTYGKIRVPVNGVNVETGERLLGSVIGDHAKLGINATVPTGAVIGLAASVASTRLLPKFLPSFSWVTEDHVGSGDPLRLLDAASAAMARRDVDMTDDEVELFLDLGQRVKTFEGRAR